jgi:hypothetical protein
MLARTLVCLVSLLTLSSGALLVAAENDDEEQGFVALFDGKSLKGWIGGRDSYTIEDGRLVSLPEGRENIYTEKEYANFVLRFEFKLSPGANNGVGLRAPLGGDAAYLGMECQILDDGHETYKDIKPYQAHGSIYGVIPAKRGHLKPTGQWNEEEITLDGRHVTVKLNGHVIVDGNLDEASRGGTIDGHEHPGLKRDKGHIGFLGHGAHLEFRNIRLKELN